MRCFGLASRELVNEGLGDKWDSLTREVERIGAVPFVCLGNTTPRVVFISCVSSGYVMARWLCLAPVNTSLGTTFTPFDPTRLMQYSVTGICIDTNGYYCTVESLSRRSPLMIVSRYFSPFIKYANGLSISEPTHAQE